MHPDIVHSTQAAEMFVIDTQMQNADADLTRKMKRYQEKNKQFVQQPVLVSQVCAYRLVTFYRHERAEQTEVEVTEEERKVTQGEYTRVRAECCVEETAYKH